MSRLTFGVQVVNLVNANTICWEKNKIEGDQLYEEAHEFNFENVEDEDEIPKCRCGWPN